MLYGRPPFPASNFNELVYLASRPHAYLRLPDSMPTDLAHLIRAMLRLDPKQRYSLLRVAQSPWFQEGLKATLSRTPDFGPPDDLLPFPKPSHHVDDSTIRVFQERRDDVLSPASKRVGVFRRAFEIRIALLSQAVATCIRVCPILGGHRARVAPDPVSTASRSEAVRRGKSRMTMFRRTFTPRRLMEGYR